VLGPLPTLYKVVVCACALLSFVGLGVWFQHLMPDSLVASAGIGAGLGLGVVVVLLLLNDTTPHNGRRAHARARTPHHR
jgi:hypothetical protein